MLHKEITETIINEADKMATSVMITGINVEDNVVTVNLFNDENLIPVMVAYKRVYSLDKIPFVFVAGESEYIQGEDPNETWNIEPIKLWFIDRQTKDDEGKVSRNDPYYFNYKTTKSKLFEQYVALSENK